MAGLKALRDQTGASSIHVTFLPKAEWEYLGATGFLQRTDQQFHWLNEGYGSFDDFLARARLAQAQGHEARAARRAGRTSITIEQVTGKDITEAHWDAFFAFYMDTGSRKWGRPYLTRTFFSLIGERMAGQDPADHGQARRPLHRRGDQLHRRPTRSTAATGAASRTIRSCISRSATTRPSTSRSRAA